MSALAMQFEGKATSGEAPVAVTSTYAVVIQPIDVQAYSRFTVYTYNAGGGAAADITSVALETAPTADAVTWVLVSDALAGDLASETLAATGFADKSLKFVRLRAKTAAGSTTARFWFCAGGYVG